MNPKDWVRGCHKPYSFGAKASLKKYFGVFAPVLSLTLLVGESLVIKQGQPEGHEIIKLYDCELPDRQFFGGYFFNSPNGCVIPSEASATVEIQF